MTEIAVRHTTIKQMRNVRNAFENLSCLIREVFSGITTTVICRLAKSLTSTWK